MNMNGCPAPDLLSLFCFASPTFNSTSSSSSAAAAAATSTATAASSSTATAATAATAAAAASSHALPPTNLIKPSAPYHPASHLSTTSPPVPPSLPPPHSQPTQLYSPKPASLSPVPDGFRPFSRSPRSELPESDYLAMEPGPTLKSALSPLSYTHTPPQRPLANRARLGMD